MRPGSQRLVGHIQSQGSWSMPSPQAGMVLLRIGTARNWMRRSASTGASAVQNDSTHSSCRPKTCVGAQRTPSRRSGPTCSGGIAASSGTASTVHSGRATCNGGGLPRGIGAGGTMAGSTVAGGNPARSGGASGGASRTAQPPSGVGAVLVPSARHCAAKRSLAARARSPTYGSEKPKPTPMGVKRTCSTPLGFSTSVNTPASTKSLRIASNSRSPASCTMGRPRYTSMPCSTCAEAPRTASAPASTIAWPTAISACEGTVSRLSPQCTATSTTSACARARAMRGASVAVHAAGSESGR
jgi:hypothetical protein